jgi:hypothetical protein
MIVQKIISEIADIARLNADGFFIEVDYGVGVVIRGPLTFGVERIKYKFFCWLNNKS